MLLFNDQPPITGDTRSLLGVFRMDTLGARNLPTGDTRSLLGVFRPTGGTISCAGTGDTRSLLGVFRGVRYQSAASETGDTRSLLGVFRAVKHHGTIRALETPAHCWVYSGAVLVSCNPGKLETPAHCWVYSGTCRHCCWIAPLETPAHCWVYSGRRTGSRRRWILIVTGVRAHFVNSAAWLMSKCALTPRFPPIALPPCRPGHGVFHARCCTGSGTAKGSGAGK